jgi:hypothetical protein
LSSIEGRARDVPEDAAFAIGKCVPVTIMLCLFHKTFKLRHNRFFTSPVLDAF